MKFKSSPVFSAMTLALVTLQPIHAAPVTNEDMSYAFGESQTMPAQSGAEVLSQVEMKETQGEYWWQYFNAPGTLGYYGWSNFQDSLNHIGRTTSYSNNQPFYSYVDNFGFGYNTNTYNPYASVFRSGWGF